MDKIEQGAKACYEAFNEGLPEPLWNELAPDFQLRMVEAFKAGLVAYLNLVTEKANG